MLDLEEGICDHFASVQRLLLPLGGILDRHPEHSINVIDL